MIISCPNCSEKYFVDSQNLKKKDIKLKCSSCNHTWFYNQESKLKVKNKEEKKVPYTSELPKTDFPIKDVEIKKYRFFNFYFFFFFFSTLFFLGFYFKHELINYFPNINKIYTFLNLETKQTNENLIIQNIEKEIDVISDKQTIIKIYGKIKNNSEFETNIPQIKATLLDINNNVLSSWFFYAEKRELLSSESSDFNTSYLYDKDNVSDIKLEFFSEQK